MQRHIQKLLGIEFVRFCIVGASGFTVNAALLLSLDKSLHSPFVAQLVASEVALFSNFMFHNRWTYKATAVRKTLSTLIVQFHLTSWVAILGSAGLVTVGIRYLHLSPIVALTIASALALGWNYAWSKYVIWRKAATTVNTEEAQRL